MTPILAVPLDAPRIQGFGIDPWWLILAKAVAVFVLLVVTTLLMIWAERRVVARMQARLGPNRVGPFGVVQGLADGIKLALKEDIVPALVDKPVYILAPVISAIPAFMAFAVIPVGGEVSIAGHHTMLQLTDMPVATLYILAMSSLGVYGIILAGWSSGSTYPLLGGLRSAAQVISYEIALGLSLVSVFLYSGSLSTSEIVAGQADKWYLLITPIAFVIYFISSIGETNRAPFDLPEAEGELVGGFHTEYSSLKFALFFLAEYINMTTVCAVATTLFLGGWQPFWPFSTFGWAHNGWVEMVWFFVKLAVLLFVFIWLRGTLPRLRYDQFMRFGWKVLIPLALVWLLVVAAFQVLGARERLYWLGIPALLVVLAAAFWPAREPLDPVDDIPERHDPYAGGFPVPALPGPLPADDTIESTAALPAGGARREVTGV